MVNLCFRHQHPEAFGRPETLEGLVPPELRYGAGNEHETTPRIAEELMGNGEYLP